MTTSNVVQYVAIGFCVICMTWAIIGLLKKLMRSDRIIDRTGFSDETINGKVAFRVPSDIFAPSTTVIAGSMSDKVPVLGNKGKILLRLSPTVVYRVEYNNIAELAMVLNLIQKEQTRPVKCLGRD
jgi:hypothetical protein